MLLYHAINAAAFMHAADSPKRRAFTESGYAWVYATVCVLHTALLAHPRLRCARASQAPAVLWRELCAARWRALGAGARRGACTPLCPPCPDL
jgi:hypothetical protein